VPDPIFKINIALGDETVLEVKRFQIGLGIDANVDTGATSCNRATDEFMAKSPAPRQTGNDNSPDRCFGVL